jgi:hypothetical protein
MKFRFSLDWLLIVVRIALVLRFVSALSTPAAAKSESRNPKQIRITKG